MYSHLKYSHLDSEFLPCNYNMEFYFIENFFLMYEIFLIKLDVLQPNLLNHGVLWEINIQSIQVNQPTRMLVWENYVFCNNTGFFAADVSMITSVPMDECQSSHI